MWEGPLRPEKMTLSLFKRATNRRAMAIPTLLELEKRFQLAQTPVKQT